jgi:radical SAM superfamily enzyme
MAGCEEVYCLFPKLYQYTWTGRSPARERFEQAVDRPDIVGINIGTRPDCLPDDVLDYLSDLNERMTVWVGAWFTDDLPRNE